VSILTLLTNVLCSHNLLARDLLGDVDNIKLAASSWSEQFVDAVRLDEV
jgi:hypothetical protein